MERIVQAMQVDRKNIADIFSLPCVQAIEKSKDNSFFVKTFPKYTEECGEIAKRYLVATESEWFCQHDDGSWDVLDDDEYQSLRLLF